MNERPKGQSLVGLVTTDFSSITRGRFVTAARLEKTSQTGVGWVNANISLGPFNAIVGESPWGSSGDLRLIPDMAARYTTHLTGRATLFDVVMSDITTLEGEVWSCCSRTMLREAMADFTRETGLTVTGAFEHEFHLDAPDLPPAHSFGLSALRRTEPFATNLMQALEEAGIEPEVIIAEYGEDQFELANGPADALTAADRAVALREITREMAEAAGWKASFAPKVSPDGVGNGVHIHFSFTAPDGGAAAFDAEAPGRLSPVAGAFCAGILRHMRALTALTAPSVPSYYRLQPHHWSAAWTWLGDKDREASLRICPTVSIGGKDPGRQFNVEYRAADACANPYLAFAAIIRAGLEGIRAGLPTPPLFTGDPELLTPREREELGLYRLPQTLPEALEALEEDKTVCGWFAPEFLATYLGLKRDEVAKFAATDPKEICETWARVI